MNYKLNKVDKFKIIFILVNIFTFVLYGQEFIWPTSASKLLTSSFGEYRPRRYHAGFDVKTWGKEGYPVFAMQDGYIWRVRISPKGYGKVVYVRHPSGYYTVYAHLSRFADPLEQLVREQQLKTASYVQEFYFKPSQFPVKQGDTIAFTGSTGIGYPHLHFEIRDDRHRPLNPGFVFRKMLPDKIAPKPLYLAFIPDDYKTAINGEHEIQVFQAVRSKKNRYQIKEMVQVNGPFHLSVKVIDFMKGALNRFNIFCMNLKIDNEMIETIQLDTLDYAFNHHSQLYFDYLLEREGFLRFQTLEKHPAFQLPFYKLDRWSSHLTRLSPGLHEGEIEFVDIKGNRSFLNFTFYYQPPAIQLAIRESRDTLYYILKSPIQIESIRLNHYFKHSPLSIKKVDNVRSRQEGKSEIIAIPKKELEGLVGSAIRIETENQLTYHLIPVYRIPDQYQKSVFLSDLVDMPQWYVLKLQSSEFIPDPAVDDKTAPYVVLERKDINRIDVVVQKEFFLKNDTLVLYGPEEQVLYTFSSALEKVSPGKEITVNDKQDNFKVVFPSGSLYDTTYVELKTLPEEVLPYDNNYPLVDKIYKISPFHIRAAKPFYVYVPYRKEYNQKHIFPVYFDQRKGKWFYLPATVTNDSTWFEIPVFSAEYFSLSLDTIPPEIKIVHLPGQKAQATGIKILVQDEFSGIGNIDQIQIQLNGKKHFFEWDPEENLVYVPSWALPKELKIIEIIVEDNAGNSIRKEIQLEQ